MSSLVIKDSGLSSLVGTRRRIKDSPARSETIDLGRRIQAHGRRRCSGLRSGLRKSRTRTGDRGRVRAAGVERIERGASRRARPSGSRATFYRGGGPGSGSPGRRCPGPERSGAQRGLRGAVLAALRGPRSRGSVRDAAGRGRLSVFGSARCTGSWPRTRRSGSAGPSAATRTIRSPRWWPARPTRRGPGTSRGCWGRRSGRNSGHLQAPPQGGWWRNETAGLAGRLIEESCLKHGVQPRVLTLHSDRGSPTVHGAATDRVLSRPRLRARQAGPSPAGTSVSVPWSPQDRWEGRTCSDHGHPRQRTPDGVGGIAKLICKMSQNRWQVPNWSRRIVPPPLGSQRIGVVGHWRKPVER